MKYNGTHILFLHDIVMAGPIAAVFSRDSAFKTLVKGSSTIYGMNHTGFQTYAD